MKKHDKNAMTTESNDTVTTSSSTRSRIDDTKKKIPEVSKHISTNILAERLGEKLKSGGRLSKFTMNEVRKHNYKDSGWIVVNNKVYDITHHVLTHDGWHCGCAASTLMAILRTLGTDCTEEVMAVHSEAALRQLQGFMIGTLVDDLEDSGENDGYKQSISTSELVPNG
jgi:nitrate reductase (NAD(P)H)